MTENSAHTTPDTFNDQLRQVLSFIKAKSSNGSSWISSLDISRELLLEYNLNIHWRTIDKILSGRMDLVKRRKKDKRWVYTLLAAGDSLVSYTETAIILVDPGEAVEAVVSLHGILGSFNGDIRICDPYLDEVTIQHLDACPSSSTIMLLTSNIRDSGKLRRTLSATQMTGHNIDIRQDAQRNLHDRYVIDDDSMLLLGTSLNGFGKKQHFVTKCGDDIRRLTLEDFNSRWAAANHWS